MPTSQGGNIGSRAKETKQSIVRAGKESTIPRGDNYELLWAKDTKTLFISTPDGLVKIGGPGGAGSLAYTTILDEGVELPKRDKLNFVGDAVTASDDAANQRTNVVVQAYTQIRKSDDTNLTKRSILKFSSAFNVSDDSTNQLTLVDLTSDSTTQRVEVAKNGTLIATRKRLNFIEGSNVTLTIADDTTNNKVDITVSTSASATDEKVKADSTDSTAGYLSDKVQKSITVDTTAHKLQLVNDQDAPGANKVYGTDGSGTKGWISLTLAPDEKVKSDSADPTAGYLDSKVQGSLTVDTNTHKLQLIGDVVAPGANFVYGTDSIGNKGWQQMYYQIVQDSSGTVATQRPKLKFAHAAFTVADDSTNNSTNVGLNVSPSSGTTLVATNRQIIAGTGLTGGGDLSSDRTLSVVDDTTNQRIRVSNSGTLVGTRREINFIPGAGISYTIGDDATNNRVNITIQSTASATDEKVKADSADSTAGYLSDKVQHSVTVDTTAHKLQLVNDQASPGANRVYGTDGAGARAWIPLWYQVIQDSSGTNLTQRRTLKFSHGAFSISDDTTNQLTNVSLNVSPSGTTLVTTGRQILTGTGLTGGGDLSADRTLSVVDDTTNQRVRVSNNGTLVGTRREINFIPGTNISYTISDNAANNRVDITISSVGTAADEKVKADSADPTAGYLDSKTQNSITVDTTTHKLQLVNDSSSPGANKVYGTDGSGARGWQPLYYQRVVANLTDVTQRYKLRFSSVFNVVDDSTNNWTSVDLPNDVTIQKVEVSKDGGATISTRKKLNFISGNSNISISVTDDSANNRANITISSTDEKVKASSSDNTPGFLSNKVQHSVTVDTVANKLQLVNDQASPSANSVYGTNSSGTKGWLPIYYQQVVANTTPATQRYKLRFSSVFSVADDPVNGWTSVDLPNDVTIQRVEVSQNSGGAVSTRKRLNFISGNSNLTISVADDSTNNRANITISSTDEKVKATSSDSTPGYLDSKTQNSITVDTTNKKLQLVNDVATVTEGYCYGRRTGDTDRGWVPMPMSETTDLVSLSVAVDITATSAPGQIIDSTSSNPAFQLVLPPGKHMVVINLESTLRASTGSSSGTAQIIVGVYKREGTTDTLIVNRRAVFSAMTANATMNASEFNSGGAPVFVTTTYNGTSTDIRGNNVTGTVIFIRAYQSNTASVVVHLAQLQSTTTIQSARIT